MDFITRQRFLTIAIIVLVLLNLFSLGAIWILQSGRRPFLQPPVHYHREGKGNIVEFLSEELKLTDEQFKEFKAIRRDLDRGRRFLECEILETRRELVEESFRPNPDSTKAEFLVTKIGENQILLEKLLFDHFVKMKSLCTPEQSEKFDSLMHEILQRSRPPDAPPPPRKIPPPQKRNNPFH